MVAIAVAGLLARRTHDRPKLRDVGPRLMSNQTSQPLALYGDHFRPGMRLTLGAPANAEIATTFVDEHHVFARIPPIALPADQSQVPVALALDGEAGPMLTVINDASYDDPTELALSPDDATAFVVSQNTDSLFRVDLKSGSVRRLPAGDGPTSVRVWRSAEGPRLLVPHAFSAELTVLTLEGDVVRKLPAPSLTFGLCVDDRAGVAYLAEHARNSVVAVELTTGQQKWSAPLVGNPRAMALMDAGGAELLAVGDLQTGEVVLLSRASGAHVASIAPTPRTRIVGGRTQDFAQHIMGGKQPRALLWSSAQQRLFVSSIGPNIGPNPQRMEVSMNGGVGSIDVAGRSFELHRGFGAGVTEGLALDEKRGRLYAADIALGLVRVLDAARLALGLTDALLAEWAIPPPARFPLIRPAADFGVQGRAGVELHSGPRALALSHDGSQLVVLNRFTGTLALIDVSGEPARMKLERQIPLFNPLAQRVRRLGQILYFADVGRTAMSCDACHPEGHTEGILFEKTHPLRIYRSPTIRASRETPPYFIPASTFSLSQTAHDVGNRNRFHNPDLLPAEVDQLTTWSAAITLLPNPFVGAEGAPPERLELLDGAQGNARAGLAVFERAGCPGCHPAPHFTTDQDGATRGRSMDVGTPKSLPLRTQWQETFVHEFPPPSLLGGWDVFPMLTSGAAGLRVEGDAVIPDGTWALRSAVRAHTARLEPSREDDLLAYLMSL